MGGYGLTYTDISDNILYSGKSYSVSNGDLFDICNDTVTTVLETILDYLNDFATDAPCLVKVSDTDDVCNYLFNKLESTDNSVTITKNSITVANVTTETVNLSVAQNSSSVVLYSDIVSVTRTTTGVYDTYSIPQATVAIGDLIEIEGVIYLNGVNVNGTFSNRLRINSTDIIIEGGPTPKATYIKFNCEFIRKNTTDIYIKSRYSLDYDPTVNQQSSEFFGGITTTLTVPDLDNNTLPITLDTVISGTGFSFDFNYMIIKHIKAI